jgi:hypothetical protein
MRNAILGLALLMLALAARPAVVQAQERAEETAARPARSGNVYRVEFAIQETEEGKPVNTRSYMIMVEDAPGRNCRVRTGSRVPIVTPSTTGSSVPTIQYMDVGVNLDCDLRERTDGLRLQIGLEVTNFAQGQEGRDQPLLRTIRFEGVAAVVPGKPTVVGALDDATSKRRYELEVTATKVR